MFFDFNLLDYIWKGLFIAVPSTAFTLIATFMLYSILKKTTSVSLQKWFFNFQSITLLFIFGFCFFILKTDPELASACFTKFVKKYDSYTTTRILSGIYLTGLSVLLFFDFIVMLSSFLRLQKYRKSKHPLIEEMILQLSTKIQFRQKVQVFTTEGLGSPYVSGLFIPRLYFPLELLKNLDKHQLESVLAHELIHLKERDSLWLLLNHIGKRLLYFNPLIYCVSKKHRQFVELAADEGAVTKACVRPQVLLETLLKITTLSQKQSASSFLVNAGRVNASRGFKDLEQRMLSLGAVHRRPHKSGLFVLLTGVLLVTSFTFTISHAQMSFQDQVVRPVDDGLMCSQITHEKIIDTWIQREKNVNKCENEF